MHQKVRKERPLPPPQVFRAIVEGDTLALSHFGKRGAEKRKLNLEAAKMIRLIEQELMLKGTQEMAKQANEHICPVD